VKQRQASCQTLGGMKLKNLHVETAGLKAELEHSADFAFRLGVVRPPSGKTFARVQCLISVIQGRLI
jgi:hypothetical protein